MKLTALVVWSTDTAFKQETNIITMLKSVKGSQCRIMGLCLRKKLRVSTLVTLNILVVPL